MPQPIHFLHIAKTGGITIWNLIRDNYESVFLNSSPLTFQENYKKEGVNAEITIGHTEYALVGHFLPPETRYFTFLRDPLSWSISYYNYQNIDENSPDRKAALRLSFEDFYLGGEVPLRDNFQTRMLLTETFCVDTVTEAHLADAKKNLTENIELVGLTEAFDESILLIQGVFGWKNILYRKENVSKYLDASPDIRARLVKREDLSQDLIDRLAAENRYDMELYAYACGLMEKQKAAYGPSFDTDLQTYRNFNRQFQKKLTAYLQGLRTDEIGPLNKRIQQLENSRAFRLGNLLIMPARAVVRLLRRYR